MGPSAKASCWEGSAAKAYPRLRHSSVCRSIPSGSFALIITRSTPPLRSSSGSSSMLRASLIAPE